MQFDRIKFFEKNYEKLKQRTIAVVGCGSLGSRSTEYLARYGLNFILIDFDKIEKSNIDTQIYTIKEVGKYKACILKNRAKQINPKAKIKVYKKKLDENNAIELLKNADLMIDGTDNLKTRKTINEACKQLKIPWVFGAIEKKQGMTTCFGKKYEFEKIIKKTNTKKPFGTAPQIAGIVAGLQTEQAIKLLLNKKFDKKMIIINLEKMRFDSIENAYF